MKILWMNPSFLDYRIPVYERLNELSSKNFYILFSKRRCKSHIPINTKKVLGDHAICFEYDRVYNIGINHTMSNKHIDIPITRGLYKEVEKINPDIIIAEGFFQWTPIALRYCLKHKKPLMIAYERTKRTERNCPRWRTLYRKIVDRYTKGYLANGILTKQYLEEVIKVDPSKIYIGGMSADSKGLVDGLKNFKDKESFKRSLNIGSGITYLYVGRLIELKGVNYLLDAWRKHIENHAEDKLLIIGGGEKLKEYASKYNDLGSIYFSGAINYSDIYKYYAVADVFVIPTLEDNWSLVVPEAMACGLPIACSIYNGCYPELVREGINGKLFDPLKKETIIDALEYFHSVNLKSFGEKSKEIEKEYNYLRVSERIYKAVEEVYNSSI